MNLKPASVEELLVKISETKKALPRGGGSKPSLSTPKEGGETLEMSGIAGLLSYDPGEFTFTALAGTPIAQIQLQLEQHGQYLPFDPPLIQSGSTLGGAVASGLNGSGSYRYGGMRDFILAICFANSQAKLVRAGAKVVKNSAGFDLPKLMVGSLGQLGVLVELTFKVFPRPEALATVRQEYPRLEDALDHLWKFASFPLELEALDLEVRTARVEIWARIGGLAKSLPKRIDLLLGFMNGGEVLQNVEDDAIWENVREMAWLPSGWSLIKVPLTPSRIPLFEGILASLPGGEHAIRRYLSGGQQAWLALPQYSSRLDDLLSANDLSALAVIAPPGLNRLGIRRGDVFARRVKAALDPLGRFGEITHATHDPA